MIGKCQARRGVILLTTLRWLTMPFNYSSNFFPQLNRWLSQTFYTSLPQAGFEVREEQIYTSYRIANVLRRKEVLLAEAGSGTGKTFAYLLPTLCYAREKGQPVVIACSSDALQQQMVSPRGDIATLAGVLGLEISFALARDPENYICPIRADAAREFLAETGQSQVLEWLDQTERGERNEIPQLKDEVWTILSYQPSLDCTHCRRRGFCYLARERTRLRKAEDFIICSHQLFFKDLWSRREQQQRVVRGFGVVEKQTPHLPLYSAVIFDEGHLLEQPALAQLGTSFSRCRLVQRCEILARLPLASDNLLLAVETVRGATEGFFAQVQCLAATGVNQQRPLHCSGDLLGEAAGLRERLADLQEELALYNQDNVNQYIGELDRMIAALDSLGQEDPVTWWDAEGETFHILPRQFSAALGRELMAQGKPLIFTSATLDAGDDFAWFKGITGLRMAGVSKVGSSFDLPQQMRLCFSPVADEQLARVCHDLVKANRGSSLLLLNTPQDLANIRDKWPDSSLVMLWDGQGEKSHLVEQLCQGKADGLVGTGFWEGIDVPGPALTMVIIPRLPFPPNDPVTQAKRAAVQAQGKDPRQQVDLPAMQIKLRQGIGRLIRTNTDQGTVVILDPRAQGLDNLALILPRVPRVDIAELI